MNRRYQVYVNSGTKWIGDIPAHWRLARLDQVAKAWTSNVDKHSVPGQPPVLLCNYTDVYNNDEIVEHMNFMPATATPDQIERFRLRRGDTVITKDSETADDIGIPAYVDFEAENLVCGYHLAIIRPRATMIVPRFLFWVMKAKPTLGQWEVLASGVTRVGIRSSDLRKATLALPHLSEQQSIAEFLDRETKRIDALIAEQQGLIEVLRERRISVVDTVVARGLNKGVTLVDSGTPWIGMIPMHWQVRPLWSMFKRVKNVGHPGEQMLSVFRAFGVVAKDSRDNINRTAENRNIYQLIHPGWLVANRMKAWQGSVGVSTLRGIVSGHYICFAPKHNEDPVYLNWLFRSSRYTVGYGLISRGVRVGQAEIDNDSYRVLPVIVPPIEEQRQIADYLDDQTDKIDALIGEAEGVVAVARERRAALITAAVTGQIDVREEVA